MNIDGVTRYHVNAQVTAEPFRAGMRYTPVIEIQAPNMEPISLSGSVALVRSKALDIDLSLKGVFMQPIRVEGNYSFLLIHVLT